ncbi:hypothetical protein HQN89_26700 [Paenibacillus frigoriresistens]|nr:hypothetical protein [Paenibacillus frigoriresistens]
MNNTQQKAMLRFILHGLFILILSLSDALLYKLCKKPRSQRLAARLSGLSATFDLLEHLRLPAGEN